MNVRLFGLAAAMTMAMGVVACGDDTGGAGGAGTGGGSSSGGDSTTSGNSPTSSSSGNNTTTGGEGGDPTGGSTGSGEGGDPGVGGAGGGEGGAPSDAPCADECADDVGCDMDPPEPGDACGECVSAEVAMGTASDCAVEGALGPCCGDDPNCPDYVSCVLAGGTTEECATDNPDGGERARVCVLESCGECGSPE